MTTYVATAVMAPTGIRIDWRDKAVPRPDQATVLEFVDELRGIAAHRPESRVSALVRNMSRDAAYHAGSLTSVTIDHVGAIVCHKADQADWQEATAPTKVTDGYQKWAEPELPVEQNSPTHGNQPGAPAATRPSTVPNNTPSPTPEHEPDALFGRTFRAAPGVATAPVSLPALTVATGFLTGLDPAVGEPVRESRPDASRRYRRSRGMEMNSDGQDPAFLAEHAATLRQYPSIDAAIQAQRTFDSRSIIGEMSAALGQYGLHFAQTPHDVEVLVSTGAPLDGVRLIEGYDDISEHWETPLVTALVDQRLAVAAALLRLGADVDATNAIRYPDNTGFLHTALHLVASRGDVASAARLIAAGAGVDRRTTNSLQTPLHNAAESDHTAMVELLLQAGARPDIPRFDRSLPVDLAGPGTRRLLVAVRSGAAAPSGGTPGSTPAAPGATRRDGPFVVGIALACQHGLALKSDGTVIAWGNSYGVPAGLAGVTAIGAGSTWSVALKEDGTVTAWGNSSAGATDVPRGLSGVVAVAAGMGHCLALKMDGTVVAWGSNSDGQTDVPYGLSGVTAIAAGSWHSLALRRDGSVVAWGHPDSDQRSVPYGLRGAVAIAAGSENSSAILADGSVIDWGPDTWFGRTPPEFHDVTAIAYGWRHRIALRKDGTVVSDGGEMGGLDVAADLSDVVAIAGASAPMTDHRSFLALKRDGSVVAVKHEIVDSGIADRRYPALDIPDELIWPSTAGTEASAAPSRPTVPSGQEPASGVSISVDDLPNGQTALMTWAAAGNDAQVRALLDQGVDVDAADDDGDGALRYAMSSRNTSIFEMLLESGADPDTASTSASGRVGYRILHAVSEMGWDEAVQSLVGHGADVDARGQGGTTPLMLAAGAGWDPCVRALVAAGAGIDAIDADGDAVLYYAASNGHKATVTLLLELGADPDPLVGASGQTPLTVAAQLASPLGVQRPQHVPPSDYLEIVLELVRAGANATAMYEAGLVLQDSSGATAPLWKLSQLADANNGWHVVYTLPEFRRTLMSPASAPRPQQSVPVSPPYGGSPTSGRAHAQVEIHGSTQASLIRNPTVKAYWNGAFTGELKSLGGNLVFPIDSPGELRLKAGIRSTTVQVDASGATFYLGWDRTWGRLIASREPYRGK